MTGKGNEPGNNEWKNKWTRHQIRKLPLEVGVTGKGNAPGRRDWKRKCPGQAWLEKEMSREGMTGKKMNQAVVSGKGNEQGRKWQLKERNQVGMTGKRKFSVKSDWIKKWQEWLKEKEPGRHGSKKKCTRLESRKKLTQSEVTGKASEPGRSDWKRKLPYQEKWPRWEWPKKEMTQADRKRNDPTRWPRQEKPEKEMTKTQHA